MAITASNFLSIPLSSTNKKTISNVPYSNEYVAEKNRGGLAGGVAYTAEKLGLGFLRSVEGIWDFVAGGIAELFGAHQWAERQFKNDWVNYNHADEWYNPGAGWKLAGDVAGGIGTSAPAIAVNLIPGLGNAASAWLTFVTAATPAAGSGVSDSVKQTGSLTGKEWAYGTMSGATEGVLEHVTNAIGAGAGSVIKSFTKNAAKNVTKRGVLITGAKLFGGEAFEEGMSEWLNPYYAQATYDPNAKLATPSEIIYSSFVGGLSGLATGGAGGLVNNAVAKKTGAKIVDSGNTDNYIKFADGILSEDEANPSGSETMRTLRDVRDKLKDSMTKTGGKVTTERQKRLLGELSNMSLRASMNDALVSEAAYIVQNADAIAQTLSQYGYTDAEGNDVRYTADALREGLFDKNGNVKRGALQKALETNISLRTLAAQSAAGKLLMDTESFADSALSEYKVASESEFETFIENASDITKNAIAHELGIGSLDEISMDEFNNRLSQYMANGGGEARYLSRAEKKKLFEENRETKATKKIPARINMTSDGIRRFEANGENIGIEKSGDTYTVYDYTNRAVSKPLTKEEVNAALKQYARSVAEAEKTAQSAKNAAEVSEVAQEQNKAESTENNGENTSKETSAPKKSVVARAREIAETKVKDYDKLSERNKSMVRKVIRQGVVKGIHEDLLIDFANVSAHARVDVVFDKEPLFQGLTEDGREVYANGAYDPHSDTIYINPDVQTSDGILIHELDHALRKTVKGGKVTTKIYERAIKATSEDTYKRIVDKYDLKSRDDMTEAERAEIAVDEANAYFAQNALGNKDIVKHLISERPNLKQRILDFFKGAVKDYQKVPKLERQAARYYKQFKKWFDDFAGKRRYGTIQGGASMRTADVRYSIKYPSFSDEDISNNMDMIADMEAVATIDASKLEKTGKKPFDLFLEYFDVLGNNIASSTFGDIALNRASAKSEIRHGITAEKVASLEAIPAVIEQGKVIFSKKKPGTDVDRIVIAAPIKIADADYYMGVMLQRDTQNQRLYLHNVVAIKKEEATILSQDDSLTNWSDESDSRLFITSILQKAINVKAEKQKTSSIDKKYLSAQAKLISNKKPTVNPDMRMSLPDTDIDGKALTPEQKSFFAESAIKAVQDDGFRRISPKGSLMPVYHGTNTGEFYEFDINAGSSNDAGWYGKGFYFAFNKGEAEYYGKRVLECYLNIKNPFVFDDEMQVYDGVTSGDVNFDFASFVLNMAEKFPDIAKKLTIDVAEHSGGDSSEVTDKNFVDLATELKEIYDSKRLSIVKVYDDVRGDHYEYRIYNDVENMDIPAELKKVIQEKDINSAYWADYLRKEGEISKEQYEDILDAMEKYGETNFETVYLYSRFETRKKAEAFRLSAALQYLSEKKYSYVEQHIPEHFMMRIGNEFSAEIQRRGYDGVLQSLYGDEVVAFNPNQIKLTTNKNPTASPDMRFSVDLYDDAEIEAKDTAPTIAPETTVGELRQALANSSRRRVYSKKQIVSLVKNFAVSDLLTQKTQGEIADAVWQSFNSASRSDIEAYSRDVAEFIMSRTMRETKVERTDADYTAALERLAALRTYIGRVTFTEADRAEIRKVADRKGEKSILGRWGYKGERRGGRVPMDVFVTDVAREVPGMAHLEEMHPADAFLEIDSIYQSAKKIASDKWEDALFGASDAELEAVTQGIADEIISVYETEGKKTEFATKMENILDRAKRSADFWKAEHDKSNKLNRYSRIAEEYARRLKDVKNKTFANSTQQQDEALSGCINKLSTITHRGVLSLKKLASAMDDISSIYSSDEFKKNVLLYKDEENSGLYSEYIKQALDYFTSKGDFRKSPKPTDKALTVEGYKALIDVMSYFEALQKNYKKVWRNDQRVDALPLAKKYVEIAKRNEKLKGGVFFKFAGSKYAKTFFDPAALVRRMDYYADGFFTEMYDDLRQGLVKAKVLEMETLEEYENFIKEHKGYIEGISSKTVKLRGFDIPITQVIDLYMASKQWEAQAALAVSGFQYTDLKGKTVSVPGRIDKDSGYSNKDVLEEISQLQSDITALLTGNDKAYIKLVEDIYNRKARTIKMLRDYQKFGFSNVKNGYYYPITRVHKEASIDTSMKAEMDRVSNASFNKDRKKGAKQALILQPVDNRLRRHVKGVCNYHHISPVVDSFNMLFNIDIGGNPDDPTSVSSATKNTWKDGFKYFQKLMSDAQGVSSDDNLGRSILEGIRGAYATSVLGLNPKVLATQLSSLASAMSVLDLSSAKGFATSAADVEKYCKLAKLRKYENTAAYAQSVIDRDGIKKGAGGRTKSKIKKFNDALMKPITWMDSASIGRIFGMCQYEVETKQGYKVGTEKNKIEAGKLLEKTILETQQNTLSTERSAAMRSSNEFYKGATMFSADAMKMFGRVIDGFGEVEVLRSRIKSEEDANVKSDLEKKLKTARKKKTKAVAAIATSAIYMAIVARIFSWLKGKDKEEDESVVGSVAVDFFSNTIGGLPVFRDVYSYVAEGYEREDMLYSGIYSMARSYSGLGKTFWGNMSGESSYQDMLKALRDSAFATSTILGIPSKNLYNYTYGAVKRISPNAAYKWDAAFYEKNYKSDISAAIEEGDYEKATMIYEMLIGEQLGSSLSEKSVSSFSELVKSGYKVNPRDINGTLLIDGEEYALTEDEQAKVKQAYSVRVSGADKLIDKSAYKSMTEEEKAKTVNTFFDLCYNVSLYDALGYEKNNAVLLSKAVGEDVVAVFKTRTSGITSDKDKNGKTIEGSKRKKFFEALSKTGMNTNEMVLLATASGYTIKDGDIKGVSAASAKNKLLKYILSLNVSKAEKERLAEMCGFEVKNGKILVKSK